MLSAFHEAFLAMTLLTVVGIVLAYFLHDRVLTEWKRNRQTAGSLAEEELLVATEG